MVIGVMFPILMALASIVPPAPRTIYQTAHAKQQARWAPVKNYTILQKTDLMEVPTYYEKIEVNGQATFRLVPQTEWERARTGVTQEEVKGIAAGMAQGLDLLGGALGQQGGPMGAYVQSMTSDMAKYYRMMSEYEENSGHEDAAKDVRAAASLAGRIKLAGRETVGGRPAFVLRAENLSDIEVEQPAGGPAVKLEVITMWMDAEHYVPLRTRTQLRAEGGGTFTLELLEQDYRQVESLYEPTRQVMRISGMMAAMATDPKQKKEMEKMRKEAEKARAQLDQMDEQLAKLSPAERRMIEGRMEKAKKQLEMMANGDVAEAEVGLSVYAINKGPPLDWKPRIGSDR